MNIRAKFISVDTEMSANAVRYNLNIQDEGVFSHNFIYLNIFNESHIRLVFFCNCSLFKQFTCSLLYTSYYFLSL